MGGLVSKGTSAFRGSGDKKENGRVIYAVQELREWCTG